MHVDRDLQQTTEQGTAVWFAAFLRHLAEAAQRKGSPLTFDEMHILLGPFLEIGICERHQAGWYKGVALAYHDQKQCLLRQAFPAPLHRARRRKEVAHVS